MSKLFEKSLEELRDERERLILEVQYRPAGTQRQNKNWNRITELTDLIHQKEKDAEL